VLSGQSLRSLARLSGKGSDAKTHFSTVRTRLVFCTFHLHHPNRQGGVMQNRRDLTRKVLPTGRKSPMELSRRGEADPRDIMERDWRRARANPRNGSRLAGYLKFYGEYGSRSHGFGDYDFRNWSPPDEDIGE